MAKAAILVFFSAIAVLVSCDNGRMPDSVLWMQEGNGVLSATKTGELFVFDRSTGLKKFSGQSGEMLWEIALSNERRQIKATENGDLVVMEISASPTLSLLSGDNGGQLWSRSIEAHSIDSAGTLIVVGGLDRTYLFNLDGSLRWDAPIAEGHTGARATVLVGDSGDVVRWEKLGQQYVLQGYDGADGSPTWSVETSRAKTPSSASLSCVGDLVVASLNYYGELQVGEYTLPQSTPYRIATSGVFAINSTGMLLWAREVLIDRDKMTPGLNGEVLLAGVPFEIQNIDGHELGENRGVLMALDTSSGKTISVLSFFTDIGSLTSDQHGRFYLTLSGRYQEFLVGLKQ